MIFVDTAAVGKGEDYGLDILGLLSNPTVQQVGGQLLNGMIRAMSGVGGRMGNMGLAGGVGGGGLGHLINEAVGAVNALGGVQWREATERDASTYWHVLFSVLQ